MSAGFIRRRSTVDVTPEPGGDFLRPLPNLNWPAGASASFPDEPAVCEPLKFDCIQAPIARLSQQLLPMRQTLQMAK
jgi:hypothetical protein